MRTFTAIPEAQADKRIKDGSVHRWWWAVQGSFIAAALLYLYATVLPPLVADWANNPNNAHGFLVPFISAYFVWQRRHELVLTSRQPSWWGMVMLLIGVGILFLGTIGAEFFLMRFSMIVVMTGLVVFLLGWPFLRILRFPIAFLLFMIPWPAIILNMIAFPLQLLAARLATSSLQFIGLPVFREGNVISLPHTTLEVVEACSGIRSLVSLLALAVVFACLTQRRVWKRGVVIMSAIPIALVANAFRIWGTGLLAHLYGTQAAEGFYHTFAGGLVFVVAFVLLMLAGLVLSLWRDPPATSGNMRP